MMTYEKPKLTMVCDDAEVLGKVPNTGSAVKSKLRGIKR